MRIACTSWYPFFCYRAKLFLTGDRTCPAKERYSSCVFMVRFVLNCFCIILMIPFTFVIVELAGGETEIELEFISLLMTFHLGYKLINFQTQRQISVH